MDNIIYFYNNKILLFFKIPYNVTFMKRPALSPFGKEVEHKAIVLSAIARESEFRTLPKRPVAKD